MCVIKRTHRHTQTLSNQHRNHFIYNFFLFCYIRCQGEPATQKSNRTNRNEIEKSMYSCNFFKNRLEDNRQKEP